MFCSDDICSYDKQYGFFNKYLKVIILRGSGKKFKIIKIFYHVIWIEDYPLSVLG